MTNFFSLFVIEKRGRKRKVKEEEDENVDEPVDVNEEGIFKAIINLICFSTN